MHVNLTVHFPKNKMRPELILRNMRLISKFLRFCWNERIISPP
jgi:hypothetical protein